MGDKLSNLNWLQTTYGHNDDLELFWEDVWVYVVWVQCAYVGVSLSMCECTCATASMWISEDNLKSPWSFFTLFDAIWHGIFKEYSCFPDSHHCKEITGPFYCIQIYIGSYGSNSSTYNLMKKADIYNNQSFYISSKITNYTPTIAVITFYFFEYLILKIFIIKQQFHCTSLTSKGLFI